VIAAAARLSRELRRCSPASYAMRLGGWLVALLAAALAANIEW
jgi:hypothetical protein